MSLYLIFLDHHRLWLKYITLIKSKKFRHPENSFSPFVLLFAYYLGYPYSLYQANMENETNSTV